MCGVSPRTPLILLLGVLAVTAACGEPPQPQPTSPPYAAPSASAAVLTPPPITTQPLPTLTAVPTAPYPTAPYPTATVTRTGIPTGTSRPTRSPGPTPSHAPKCTGEPTGQQILALIQSDPGMPAEELRVFQGPFCAGTWSFTTVEVAGKNADEVEPLMVVSTGKGSTLALVAAGSDVCVDRVQTGAPPGIRVLACGF